MVKYRIWCIVSQSANMEETKMLVIRLYATDIDYNTVAEAVMPYIAKGLSDKENLFYDILKNVISKDDGKPSGISKLTPCRMGRAGS